MIDKFLVYLELKNASRFTLRNYRFCLQKFMDFYQRPIENLVLKDVWDYRMHLRRQNLSPNWIEFHVIALKSWLKYLNRMDFPTLNHSKIEIAKYNRPEPAFLFRDEMEKIFQVQERDRRRHLRNQAIIRTLYSTGCRVSELTSINRNDINLKTREFRVLGKGGKYRLVFLSEMAAEALQKYLSIRRDKQKPLFIDFYTRRRISKESIERIVRSYAKKAGIVKKVTPHTLRHTFATEMLRNGADLMSVKEFLGHSSVRTTQVYLHITDVNLRMAHFLYHR